MSNLGYCMTLPCLDVQSRVLHDFTMPWCPVRVLPEFHMPWCLVEGIAHPDVWSRILHTLRVSVWYYLRSSLSHGLRSSRELGYLLGHICYLRSMLCDTSLMGSHPQFKIWDLCSSFAFKLGYRFKIQLSVWDRLIDLSLLGAWVYPLGLLRLDWRIVSYTHVPPCPT